MRTSNIGKNYEQIYDSQYLVFRYRERFNSLYKRMCCKKYFTEKEKAYENGRKKIMKEMDIVNIIMTMQKLKAGLSAVIKNDSNLIYDAKKIYNNEITISTTPYEQLLQDEMKKEYAFSTFCNLD